MNLLDSHLEQITLSSNAIAQLPFPPPRIFTNALLGSHDITALIRDTESHERALFQIDPSKSTYPSQRKPTRQGTQFQPETEKESIASRIYSTRNSQSRSAVARVLGSDLMGEIKRSVGISRQSQGEVDIEVLLKGAEILCGIYPVPGVQEKVASLRYRHQTVKESLAQLEDRVADNTARLERMSQSYEDAYDDYDSGPILQPESIDVTDDDIQRELDEIRDLERRKLSLESHVRGMEKDLSGWLQ